MASVKKEEEAKDREEAEEEEDDDEVGGLIRIVVSYTIIPPLPFLSGKISPFFPSTSSKLTFPPFPPFLPAPLFPTTSISKLLELISVCPNFTSLSLD